MLPDLLAHTVPAAALETLSALTVYSMMKVILVSKAKGAARCDAGDVAPA